MELKYTEKPTTNQDKNMVNMLLYGEIGSEINARYFIDEMQWHHDSGKNLQVKINSVGGSVFDGYGIMNAIEEMGADTYIVGVAASMAGVIAQVGKKRLANHRATFMAHAPSNGSKDLLSIVSKTLSRELASRSALSEAEVQEIMDGGEDVWFDADTLYAKGLIDQLITSGQKLTNSGGKNAKELYAAYDGLLNNVNKNQVKMKNVLNQLELAENRTEADVVNAVKGLQDEASKVANLVTENTVLKGRILKLEETAKGDLKNKATVLVENAIKAGKVSEDKKDAWIEQAVSNFDLTAETLGSLSKNVKKAESVTNLTNQSKNGDVKSYKWYMENDEEALNKMYEENREQYDNIVNAYQAEVRNSQNVSIN